LGVQDAAARERRHDPVHAHDTEVGIDAHFANTAAEGAGRIRTFGSRLFVGRGRYPSCRIVPAEDGRDMPLPATDGSFSASRPSAALDVVRIGTHATAMRCLPARSITFFFTASYGEYR